MGANQEVARIFDQMAAGLELLGANPFRANAHARAARTLRDLSEDVTALVEEDPATAVDRLSELPSIGRSLAQKVFEYVQTGRLEEHEKVLREVPAGLFDILEIPGVGPKMAKALWEELGITSVAELEAKLDDPELRRIPRMGEKTIDNLRKAIAFAGKSGDRVPLGKALPLARWVVEELEAVEGVSRVEYAGSLRRGREMVGDLDFLVACVDPRAVQELFTALPGVGEVLARGDTKCSVRLERERVACQADLRIVAEEAYGAALLYFTGSKDHNVRLREESIRRGMRLNEYGLFAGTEERPQDAGEEPLAAATEEAIYQALGFPWIPPELREDHGELDAPLPEGLIEVSDVVAELHAHTTASDGKMSIEELTACARGRGFHTVAVTDHSPSQVIAGGLDPDRLKEHMQAVRAANRRTDGIDILAGAEVDILADGRLDYDDELLALLDLVVASPHAALRQGPEEATERLLRAIRHPLVHVIGHPTGRMIPRREGLSPRMTELFAAAAKHGTALEINANPRRLDLRDRHVRGAVGHGCLLAIDTDAHREPHFDFLLYGVLTARRGGLPADRCINCWPAERLRAWLERKRR